MATKPEPIDDKELHEHFDDYLNAVEGVVEIAGYKFDTAEALKQLDETAYDQDFSNWLDGEIKSGFYTDEIDGEYFDASEYQDYLDELEEEKDNDHGTLKVDV